MIKFQQYSMPVSTMVVVWALKLEQTLGSQSLDLMTRSSLTNHQIFLVSWTKCTSCHAFSKSSLNFTYLTYCCSPRNQFLSG